jgi:hypothetical protein
MDEGGFDYKEEQESDETPDFQKLKPCPHCKKEIPIDSTMCLYCGEESGVYGKPSWVIWAAAILLFVLICVSIFMRLG